ncbi:hypothetical protein D030_1800A, partial [Vibrio parahaemolyticus AQ3810]
MDIVRPVCRGVFNL